MKSFSVIIPVYNEPRLIIECLKSLENLNYKNYEVIVVSDASTDETPKNIKNFIKGKKKFRLINNKKNEGRAKTRLIGAKNAKFSDLIFIDARVTLEFNVLKHFNGKSGDIIIPRDVIQKGNIYGKILKNLKTRFVYRTFTTKITKNNFDHAPKGLTACYFKKSLFLKNAKKFTNKNISDDTKLLYETLKFTNHIIRDKNFKITYHHRKNLAAILTHTFNRGPKFVDYYLESSKRFFPHLLIIYILTLANFFFIINPIFFLYELAALILAIITTGIYISQTTGQFLISLYFLPLVAMSFYFGLIKGIIIKLIK